MAKLIAEIERLLGQLTTADLAALPPAERERFAQLLRHLAEQADRVDRTGVLKALGDGDRDC